MASGSAQSLPLKLGLTLWSGCQRVTFVRGTSTALSGFSNSPHPWNRQYCSAQSLMRPRRLPCNAQPLVDTKITPPLPQILLNITRKFHSEIPGKGPESSTQRDQVIDPFLNFLASVFKVTLFSCLAVYFYEKGRKRGAQDLTAQLPEGEIFAEREKLQKEDEKVKDTPEWFMVFPHCHCGKCKGTYNVRQNQREKLAKKVEALDKEELEHLRQRTMVLEKKLETQKASTETDRAWESPHEAVNARILPDKTHTETVDDLYSEGADPLLRSQYVGTREKGPLKCANCRGRKAIPRTRQVEMSPSANVVPQDPSQGPDVSEASATVPHQDDSMAHAKPDTKVTGQPKTKIGPKPATDVVLEGLSANNDATKQKMSQIKRAKEALKNYEKELRAQDKDRKKRIQDVNAPKSNQTSPIALGVLLGSALAFGVTMITSK